MPIPPFVRVHPWGIKVTSSLPVFGIYHWILHLRLMVQLKIKNLATPFSFFGIPVLFYPPGIPHAYLSSTNVLQSVSALQAFMQPPSVFYRPKVVQSPCFLPLKPIFCLFQTSVFWWLSILPKLLCTVVYNSVRQIKLHCSHVNTIEACFMKSLI